MIDSGKERDKLHYMVSEDDGFDTDCVFVLSPREPGKTTSIILDKVYGSYKKYGLPSVVLVNHAADVTEAYLASFEETVNTFKGYEIHTKYPTSASQGGVTIIKDKETNEPWIYVISMNTPKTRLKRLNLGKVALMWYDECNVDVNIGEKWPDNLSSKWNELYTTLARNSYPKKLKFYATGNFYTRYNPLMVYLGVDCAKLTIGKKSVFKKDFVVGGEKITIKTLVDCYQLKPELREYILKHNPGYSFDDTYRRYFEGEAIGDIGLPIVEKQPEGYQIKYIFKLESRYLYIWRSNCENSFLAKYWLESTNRVPGSHRDVFVISIEQLVSNSILSSSFKRLFEALKFAISTSAIAYNSPESFYAMQQLWQCI